MPRQQKPTPSKERRPDRNRGGTERGAGRDKITFVGKCDGADSPIAKLNGESGTFAAVKNVGKCRVTLFCINMQNEPIASTEQSLNPGEILALYVAPRGTDSVRIRCARNENTSDTCSLELLV